jgi:hypothetical protein
MQIDDITKRKLEILLLKTVNIPVVESIILIFI